MESSLISFLFFHPHATIDNCDSPDLIRLQSNFSPQQPQPASAKLLIVDFYCCDKDHDQKQCREGGVYLTNKSQSITEGSRDHGGPAHRLALRACSDCLLIQGRTACPRTALPTMRCTFPIYHYQKNSPLDLPKGQCVGDISSIDILNPTKLASQILLLIFCHPLSIKSHSARLKSSFISPSG